ncbi:FAD-dependent monooxygenase [Streptomyces peucetius]|uniref:FAD-dependent monooxygenase n=2 Tax=Streptomyces peucetius TaxID=1950 RepID=A0ABY6I2E3_STRPE|nr:FAD-dependent monooxygenase [Streptomyces peucetius]
MPLVEETAWAVSFGFVCCWGVVSGLRGLRYVRWGVGAGAGCCGGGRPGGVTPGPDGAKLVRTLDCGGARGNRRHAVTVEELSGEASRIVRREVVVKEGRWLSRFSDFARLARSFRSDRVFLAGDAAHVQFPVGGQGLSAGVLDALDLGWKLALAVRGEAGEGLLDTYDLERPAVARVIEHARAQLALMRPGPEFDALRGLSTGLLTAGGDDASYLGEVISGQDTVLRLPGFTECPSPAAGTFLRNVVLTPPEGATDVIGLLEAGRPLLLLFGEKADAYREEARNWDGVVRVVDAAPTCEAPGGEDLAVALSAYFGGGPPGRGGRDGA